MYHAHRLTWSLLEQNPLWYLEFCLSSLFSPAEGKRHCMASYLHKQLMHLKLEGGFGMLEAHIAISMPFTSQNIHCPFIIAFIFQTFSNCPGQPATAPSFFSIISYQSFCHLSKIRDFPGTLLLKILTSPTTIWTLLSCMQFHGLIFP